MNIMKIKNFLFCLFAAAVAFSVNAETYLVSPSATTAGESISYKGMTFTVGTTAFADLAALCSASPVANSTVYVAPGTYSTTATIATAGLNFKGANAFIDPRAQSRGSASKITGSIVVNANNVTLNGFDFSDNGKVYNTAATNTTPLTGFTFIFNVLNNSTIARTSSGAGSTGFLRLGKVYTDATANSETSQTRYKSVTISHNKFVGTTGPDFVILAGLYGTTNIVDNVFKDGAHGVHIANSRGTINILNNKFDGCGTNNINDATKKGDFALRIFRNAYAGTTVINIKHNYFNNCSGQETVYPCIRVFQGHSGDDDCVTPKNFSLNVNYNAFRNKTKIHADYNYLLFLDKTECEAINCDTRFNAADDSGYQFAHVNSPSFSERERYYLNNSIIIKPSQCTFSTLKSNVTLGASTAMQSFDFDTQTGDLYTIQQTNTALSGDPKPLMISRIKSGATTTTSTMKVTYGGHGTNMAVCRIDGKLYIFCGGKGELKDDGSETKSTYTAFFRYVAGATANLKNDSFTYDGTTYPITYIKKGGNQYPSIDEGNRLFAYRTTGTNDAGTTISNFYIYDLDDILANGENATLLKKIVVTKGENSTGNYGDNGYQTWDHQGWTINGDYLFIGEGVGTWTGTAYQGKPTVWLHVYNWRKGKFSYRYRVSNSTILGLTPGELEGVKVRRDSNGHACIILGLVSSTACKETFYKYTPPETAEVTLSKGTATPNIDALSLTANSSSAVTGTVKLANEYLIGEYTFTLSGENAEQFAISSISNNNVYASTTTAKVKYTPTSGIANSTAYLRCSSPYMTDIVIPITATYNEPSTDPSITPSVNSLSMTTEEETSVSKSLTISGANLTSGISLALSGTNANLFSLSTASLGTAGGSVTVTYSPTAAGSHSATLTATSGSVTATVSISGTATEHPVIPVIDPSQFVFTKIYEGTDVPDINDGRFSTGFGDYLYLADKSTSSILRYDAAGNKTTFATVTGLGSAISSDDVGNIIVNTGFPNPASATDWVIIEPNGTQHTLTLSYPSSITAARTDAAGRALGNVLSASGGYLCLICNGATSAALFKIVNGAQSGNATAISLDWTGNTTAIAQPVATTLAQVEANPDASFMYRLRTNRSVTTKALARTTSDGFDVFTLAGTTYLIEPTGEKNYSDGFTVHEVGSEEPVGERVETITDGVAKFQSLTAHVSEDGTYATIYQNVSGNLVSIYRYGMPPTGVESVAAVPSVVSTIYYNLQGVRVTNPSAGQILIRVATLSDGSVRTSKIVIK